VQSTLEWRADAIVIGDQVRFPFMPFISRSLASRVRERVSCTVHVVQ
jgi:nucleotide-binding universal stress UspA family protein